MNFSGFVELLERIRDEVEDLDRTTQRALRAWNVAQRIQSDADIYLDSAALNLQSFYTGIERLLQLTAQHVDQSVPTGQEWHVKLLQQMSQERKNIRPAVISPDSAHALDEYRRFRHVVRNVYADNLLPGKMEQVLDPLPTVWSKVRAELLAFADFLELLTDIEE